MLLTPKHPLLSLSTEFAELCKPLELFRIHHFTYQKYFDNGERISLSNKPQWIADYYNLKLYQSSLFEKKPSEYDAGFNVWIGDYDLDVYRHGRQYYNTMHCITITEPCHDGCEHYLFSTSPDHESAIQFLANNMDILYHFILYLKDRGATLFAKAKKNSILVQEAFTGSNQNLNHLDNQTLHQQLQAAKKLFFQRTPLHRVTLESNTYNQVKLTQRELSCVAYLLQNRTAAETAQLMNLSKRTVESYLDNIKNKLGCNTKLELVKILASSKLAYALLSKPLQT